MEYQRKTHRCKRRPNGGREGKTQMAAHFDKEVITKFKLLLIYKKTTAQMLLNEAVADILEKYKDILK